MLKRRKHCLYAMLANFLWSVAFFARVPLRIELAFCRINAGPSDKLKVARKAGEVAPTSGRPRP